MSQSEKLITEKIEILPHGRGRVVVIAHKRIIKKPKTFKRRNPSLCLVRIKSNPSDFCLTSYLNSDNIVRHILFPEGRQLSYDERKKMAIASLVTLSKIVDKRYTYKQKNVSHKPSHCIISQDLRKELDIAFRRYEKWRKRNQ